MADIIVVHGAPGSGKSTQSKRLQQLVLGTVSGTGPELAEQFKQSNKLEKKIKENLGKVGPEIK